MARSLRNQGLVGMLAACVASAACSSGGDDGAGVLKGEVKILFNPMYSAFDGVRTYQLPATIDQAQLDTDAIDPVLPETVKWKVDPTFASTESYPSLKGGVLLTTRKAGNTVVTVEAETKHGLKVQGSARLQITKADPAEWERGEARYNNNMPLFLDPAPGREEWGPTMAYDASCANCHNESTFFTGIPFTVEHTPQQTAGYSDEELIEIFTMAKKPKGSKFHSPFFEGLPESYKEEAYAMLHTWVIAPEVERGIVYKLRSITPRAQEALDFERLREQDEKSLEEWEAMDPEGAAEARRQQDEYERQRAEAEAQARAEAEARARGDQGAAGSGP